MSETEVTDKNLKEVLHKRGKEQKEKREKREKREKAASQKPSRLEERREANKRAAEGSDSEDEMKDKKKEEKESGGSSVIKIVCLAALVPIVVCIPFMLTKICAFLEGLPSFVVPSVWGVYIVIMLAIIFGPKRHKATLDSVVTHNCIYLIFSLGAYYFMHVADNVPLKYRKDSLLVWNTITMILNIVMMAVDDTDYQTREREEKEKERKKEERRKRREEREKAEGAEGAEKKAKKAKKTWYNQNKYVKIAMDLLVYLLMGVALYFVAIKAIQYKRDFDQRIEEGRAPGEEKTWGYESRTGADWKPEVHEDDLKDAEIGSKNRDDEEWHPEIRDEDLE